MALVALPAPGCARPGIALHLALSVGMVGHFPGREEGGFWGLPEASACTRKLHALCPASKIGNRQMEAQAVPAPRPRTSKDSARLRPIQPPGPHGELGWGVGCLLHSPQPPQTWLPSSTEGFWSKPPPFLLPSCGGFRRQCLAQRCGLYGGWGASSIPRTVHWAGGSVGLDAPSHQPVLSNQARRIAGKQHQEQPARDADNE